MMKIKEKFTSFYMFTYFYIAAKETPLQQKSTQ